MNFAPSKRQKIQLHNGQTIVLVDSITQLEPDDENHCVITGSHGGISVVQFTLRYAPLIVFYNDAGVGKDSAGIQALSALEAHDVPAATYSHMTARIGDARDAWEHGIVSHMNRNAQRHGIAVSQPIKKLIENLF